MWDDGNDEEFLRALEESRRFYEEVEIPRLSQQVRAPSPVTISDEDSSLGPTTNAHSSTVRPFRKPHPVHQYQDEDSLPGPSTSVQSKTQDQFRKPQTSVSQDDKENEDVCEFYDGPEAEGFSFKDGKIWVYPKSDKFPIRAYQRSIVETALFHNTLVSLPTGLGKTFIAAVVMYNLYMWYPKGKIIFMAPTKPLVAQQIENCINILGIPESHTAEMTGAMHSKLRAGYWKEKRVFFLTPQVVQNDLTANICPANDVKCVVIDEAHRALGDHAYAQVIRILNSYEARFRVLALSATPGSDLEAVQKVVSNLMISHIELREEDSADIVQYTHERNLEKMVVDVGPTITRIRVKLVGIAADYAQRLQQLKLLFGTINSIPRFTVLKEWECFRREKSNTMDPATCNKINTDFATVLVFVSGLELLQTYGLRLLLNHLKNALKKGDQTAHRLSVNEELKTLMEEIDGVLNPIVIDGQEDEGGIKKKIYGHPKLDRLQEIVVSHFENFEKKGEATRAIVFCEYREGVIEICDMLKNYEPLVKPVVFMGQSTGKGGKGISQKQQLEIMDKFKEGSYNTLISTSVGEEGLDIGEVDLIICFDAKNSPIRQVQRMGRTGRKRQGRIIMLLTRGKEEQKYNLGLHKKKNIKAVLVNKENLINHLLDESPRMLPPGVQPKYTERIVEPAVRKPKKSNQQDLRKMFAKRPITGSSGPSTSCRSSIGKAAYLSEDEFEEIKSLWDIQECIKFNKIPDRVEFWTQTSDEIEGSDLTSTNIDPSTYLEFLRYPQRTHVVGNSSDSKLLSELLMWSDERREGDRGALFGGLSSQVTSTQMWPRKSKKRGRPPATDSNLTHPPKKGRPKKIATIDSHFLPKPKEDIDDAQAQSSKPKSRFIDDDDDDDISETPQAVLKFPKANLSSSTFSTPTIPQPVSPNLDLSFSTEQEADVVTVNSDDEDDNIPCSSSGYADLSSQVSRQDLYRDLCKALRNQTLNEEDDCNICDTLFLCKSLNRLVLEKKVKKVEKSWKDISKSLEEVLLLVPHLTKEQLVRHYDPEIKSESIVSQMPNFEFPTEDEMTDGLLCGGVGDLSLPRLALPIDDKSVILPHPKTSSPVKTKEDLCSLVKSKHFELEDSHKISCIRRPSFTSSPKGTKGQFSNKTEHKNEDFEVKKELADDAISSPKENISANEFEDVSFDFLALSKIDDFFTSQKSDEEMKPHVQDDSTDKPSAKPSSFESTRKSSQPQNEICKNSPNNKHEPCSPVRVQLSCGFQTPPKACSSVAEQVSPILCSQAIKKPRLGLRLRKSNAQGQILKPDDERNLGNDLPSRENVESPRGDSTYNEQVTSSSQLIPTPQIVQPPVVNFDLFDDSLLCLSDDEEKDKKVAIDEALREAIVKKTLEAKAKKTEISFTQEVSKMCETNQGLTQVMEMYDAKEKRKDVILQRADSSSVQLKEDRSISPISLSHDELNDAQIEDVSQSIIQGVSEEDLFADCDDSLFYRIDSSEQLRLTPPESESKNDSKLPEKKNHSPLPNEVSTNKFEVEVSDAAHDSGRSASPVFKPSQVLKRPSKLRLKKINVDDPDIVKEPNLQSRSEVPDSLSSKPQKMKTSPVKETISKINSEQHDYSQIDFSMFGDEFNNSWIDSKDNKEYSSDFKNKSEIEGLSVLCNKQDKRECNGVGKKVTKVEFQNTMSLRERSPDSELEAAFAKLDADRKEKKKSCGNALSSTPKISKTKSFPREKPIIKSAKGILPRKKLSLNDAKTSSIVNIQNGWISAQPREHAGPESSSNIKELSLLDFCDESLIEDFLNDDELALINDEDSNTVKVTDKFPAEDNHKRKGTSNKNFSDSSKLKENMVSVSDGLVGRKKLSLGRKATTPGLAQEDSRNIVETAEVKVERESVIIVLSSSEDDDVIQNHRRGKNRLNLTSSSEEGLNLVDSKKRKQHDFNSSLSSRSSLDTNRHPLHGNKNSALDLSAFCDDSILNDLVNDDEDQRLTGKKRNNSESSNEDVFVHKNRDRVQNKRKTQKRKSTKKKASKKRNGFIMSEAEESGDGQHFSSDGESTSLDELDSSFINDSQPDASQSVIDIHHKYLEAVRSPAGVGRFKIPNNLMEADINVYSQYPDASELDQTYANDSFCVDTEPTQYEPEMSLLELAEAKLKAQRKEKRKRKKSNFTADSSGSDDIQDDNLGRKKRLKRIKVFEETILEDDDQAKHQTGTPTSKVFANGNNSKSSNVLASADKQKNDLAKLLDEDDIDFSVIPDNFEAAVDSATEPPKPTSSKFVKKTYFMLNNNLRKVNTSSVVQGFTSSSNLQNPILKTVNSTSSSTFTSSRPVNSGMSIKENEVPCATITSVSSLIADTTCQLTQTLIIASSKQIAQSPDVLRVLRVNYKIVLVPHSVPDADYILSWRQGASRIFASDLKDKKKLEDVVKKLRQSFSKPCLIIENDRLKLLASLRPQKKGIKSKIVVPAAVDSGSNSLSPWSSASGCANAALLRQAGVQLLFSQNSDETAGYLAKLARRETKSGHGIPAMAQNVSDEVEARLNFFACLPGINYAFAFKLLSKFGTLAEFFKRCSSVNDIASAIGLDFETSRKIHKLLCEVYFSP